jgi:23S rRNA (pseudouridine1915-N3)-methyltransferase
MRLGLIAVGRLKDGPERALIDRYLTRARDLAKPLGLHGPAVTELPESRARRPEDRQREEGQAILAARPQGLLIALDERGDPIDSAGFAARLTRERDNGTASFTLVIGGADGLDPAVRAASGLTIGFGRMTLPHQIVRALVAEQLYRALTICAGHPYHRI